MDQLKLFPLSEQEFKRRSQELAELIIELVQTEEAKAAAAKSFAEEIKDLKMRLASLATIVRSEQEWRQAPAEPLREVLDHVVDQVNTGALDSKGVTVRATTHG